MVCGWTSGCCQWGLKEALNNKWVWLWDYLCHSLASIVSDNWSYSLSTQEGLCKTETDSRPCLSSPWNSQEPMQRAFQVYAHGKILFCRSRVCILSSWPDSRTTLNGRCVWREIVQMVVTLSLRWCSGKVSTLKTLPSFEQSGRSLELKA